MNGGPTRDCRVRLFAAGLPWQCHAGTATATILFSSICGKRPTKKSTRAATSTTTSSTPDFRVPSSLCSPNRARASGAQFRLRRDGRGTATAHDIEEAPMCCPLSVFRSEKPLLLAICLKEEGRDTQTFQEVINQVLALGGWTG